MRRSVAIFISLLFLSGSLFAQKQKSDTLKVKASVVCGMCKDRIEQGMAFEKGVKDVVVNLDEKEVQVIFNPQKTNPAQIRKIISSLGYDADEVPADPVAYEKLPPCCKKGNEKH